NMNADIDSLMKHHFEGGKIINHVKTYGQCHNGHLMPEWENCRRTAFHYVYDGLAYTVKKYASDTALALHQFRDYGNNKCLEGAFFAEAAWHSGVTSETKFMKTIVPVLRDVCDRDDRHSDPITTHIAEGKSVLYNKRLIGTYDDGGWIWGQVRICTPMVTSHCDLLVESDTAEYNFELARDCKKGLKSAELVIHGGVVPAISVKKAQAMEEFGDKLTKPKTLGDKLPFKFDVEINGKTKKNVKSTWKRGERVIRTGTFFQPGDDVIEAKLPHVFKGKSDWVIKIPKDAIKPKTKVALKLLSDGLVMYEKITLKLNY
ncbi:hypothetical protein ACFL1X_08325, partial [Candidatus Hydrogenedentota bacterium]